VSVVALFVALGGTTYAATGGNFILGQQNFAGTSTRLSSGVAGDAFRVTGTTTSGGRAIGGFSNTGQGVYGHSNQNAGLVGESENFDGVFGVSNNVNFSGVSAHNTDFGFGLWAAGGHAGFNTAAVHGQSDRGNAVEGISGRDIASGVYGQNNSTGFGVAGRSANGTGVMGDSSNGWAIQAFGNARQSRARGGFVKAMAFVSPGAFPSDPIRQCFNSQLPASQATSGNCGITYSSSGTGRYLLDFGFQVNDRFASVSNADASLYNQVMAVVPQPNNTQFRVISVDPAGGPTGNNRFYIVVY
jgi:hypothetical protein